MHTHLLTPLAPLVIRTGKPFGDTGGGESFPFPLPSTLSGALRTARADALDMDLLKDRKAIKRTLQAWGCRGPLLARIGDHGGAAPLFPRPADTRYAASSGGLVLQHLAPMESGPGEGCDLPDGLLPVFLASADKSKPAAGPAWWNEAALRTWLKGETPDPAHLGPELLPVDSRSHVALDPKTLAARDGQLFQSAGPDFESCRRTADQSGERRGWEPGRFGLMARFDHAVSPNLLRLGGEGRLSAVSPIETWPEIGDELAEALERARNIRLVLATPALFAGGWKPDWLQPGLEGHPPGLPDLVLRLKAAAVERWQPLSGWDLAENRPKAVRRLVPAGSVYWFEVLQAPSGWARRLWLEPVSDDLQDCRDGFGLVLPGLWNR